MAMIAHRHPQHRLASSTTTAASPARLWFTRLHADYLMTVKQAWQLALVLAELVTEAETIDGYDRITVS